MLAEICQALLRNAFAKEEDLQNLDKFAGMWYPILSSCKQKRLLMLNKRLEYFLTLAECLSFTQTAARHSVAQTAISQYIASLEEKLGVKLFHRSSHAVTLTEAGKLYYERMQYLCRYYADTEKQVRAIDGKYRGYVKVGIGLYEYYDTESFFGEFLQTHPAVKVDLFQYPYGELTEKLKAGELDVIVADELCFRAFTKEKLQTRQLFEAPMYLVASRELAQRYADGGAVDLLKGEYLITNCEDNGPSSLEFLRGLLEESFGFVPEKLVQTNSIGAQLLLVRSRHGVAIVPGFIKETESEEFVRYPLPDHRVVRYHLMMLAGNENPIACRIMEFNR